MKGARLRQGAALLLAMAAGCREDPTHFDDLDASRMLQEALAGASGTGSLKQRGSIRRRKTGKPVFFLSGRRGMAGGFLAKLKKGVAKERKLEYTNNTPLGGGVRRAK